MQLEKNSGRGVTLLQYISSDIPMQEGTVASEKFRGGGYNPLTLPPLVAPL